jgi:hypothetical protein
MNLFKVISWTIQTQRCSAIPVRAWLGHARQTRWQTTDASPKEEPAADVSTKVTPAKQSNLMEFFDTTENLYEIKIIHGESKVNVYDTRAQ